METKVSSGIGILDWLLEGGYEKDTITTIYGPAGCGKTNLCLLSMVYASKDKKTIYIDTEGSFSIARLKQITDDYNRVLANTVFLKPTNFEEQREAFKRLRKYINNKIGLIIFDSAVMLYRLELGRDKEVYRTNKEFGMQIAYLSEIARKNRIPVLITSQVYADFDNKDKIKMVGGDILRYQSKCLIEVKRFDNGTREACIIKHRSIEEGKKIRFKIIDKGVEEVMPTSCKNSLREPLQPSSKAD
ncbi:MAG: DNA repair and recombination protein RadB [Candidatus Woesearchaeota archaeon]